MAFATSIQHCAGGYSQGSQADWKGRVELSPFTDNMILQRPLNKFPKENKTQRQIINEFQGVAGFKINIPKSVVFHTQTMDMWKYN